MSLLRKGFGAPAPLRTTEEDDRAMTIPTAAGERSKPSLSCDQILKIAQADAEEAYRDLSRYRVILALEPDGWHVDYELKDPDLQGGGPHYVIDSLTGKILSRRYEQ